MKRCACNMGVSAQDTETGLFSTDEAGPSSIIFGFTKFDVSGAKLSQLKLVLANLFDLNNGPMC